MQSHAMPGGVCIPCLVSLVRYVFTGICNMLSAPRIHRYFSSCQCNTCMPTGFSQQKLVESSKRTCVQERLNDSMTRNSSRNLQTLTKHPDVQERLQAEILEAHQDFDGNLPFETLDSLPYLDAIGHEGHGDPSVDRRPAVNGTPATEIPITRGMWVFPDSQSLNTSPHMWGDDAYEWKPERWLKPLPSAVAKARIPGVYSNMMLFPGGPRGCIGVKLAQIEMNVILSVLLSIFKIKTTGRHVSWNTTGVSFPTMGEESEKSELFLKVMKLDI
ncbi:cytochrome P450 [Trametes elegans]|nr:cytochrome P450 [Trametes elegans]